MGSANDVGLLRCAQNNYRKKWGGWGWKETTLLGKNVNFDLHSLSPIL